MIRATKHDKGELLVYQSDNGQMKHNVCLEDETVWLTQAHIAELFQVKPQNITMHLKNISAEGELLETAICKEFLQVQNEGLRKVQRNRKYYNLDAIISVGYWIKSNVATRFCIWATELLKEYDGGRYFEKLLARICDIRSSEKVFWRKILDIYATSIDYDPRSDNLKCFFR